MVDHGDVEVSNLHWQVIHTKGIRGTSKARSTHDTMRVLKLTVLLLDVTDPLTWDNDMEILRGYDCVVEAINNPRAWYLINDA